MKHAVFGTQTLRRGFASLLILLSIPGGLLAAQLVGDTTPKLSGQMLVNELKKGGYVIYFRHGLTSNTGEKDVNDKDLPNCSIQRNLSPEGQAQTKAIGTAFKQLQIPVGEVYSSPYCRCLDTAKNIFGKGQPSPALHFAIHLNNSERTTVTSQLLNLLSTQPQRGINTALVSHTANLQEAVGIWPKTEGVAHVFKPESGGHFSYVGMVLPEVWTQEADTVARANDGWLKSVKRWFGSRS